MNRRSQAALEFLTTYAWAFVVIGVTMGVFYYFGFFDFGKFLPQKCSFPSQFDCIDFGLNPTRIKVKLANNLGENICVKRIGITDDAVVPMTCLVAPLDQGMCTPSEVEWLQGTEKELTFTDCSGGTYIAGERVEIRINMTYYAVNTRTKPIHIIHGKINGKVLSS